MTQTEPFDLETDRRGAKKAQTWKHQVEKGEQPRCWLLVRQQALGIEITAMKEVLRYTLSKPGLSTFVWKAPGSKYFRFYGHMWPLPLLHIHAYVYIFIPLKIKNYS